MARHVAMKLRLRTQAHGRRGTYVMGREILAMILNHFRTPGQRETAFTMEHIIRSQYLGDANIEVFYEKWMEMVTNMMPDDIPPDDWLRDVLYKKIRNSHLLMFDIKQYESWIEGDPRRSYQHLLDVMERQIARIREDKHVAAREKYARDFAGGGKPTTPTPTTPAPQDANPKAKAKATAKEKAAPKAKAKVEAAPVLPSPNGNNTPKVKGKGRTVESRRLEVRAHETRRRSHAISTLSRSLARKGRIVNTVMTRKHLMLARLADREREAGRRQGANLQPTRSRRLMNHAGIGQKGSVDMVTSATNGMIHTCSIRHPTLSQLHPMRLLHFYMMIVTSK